MNLIVDPSLVLYLPLYKADGASFISGDARGHLCTVTGASRTAQGYDFNGAGDKIMVDNAVTSYPVTLCIWARPDNKTSGDVLFYSPLLTGGFYTSNYFLTHSSIVGCSLSHFTNGVWAFIVISARDDAADANIYIDCIERTIYTGNNYGRGGAAYQIANRNGANFFDGAIGEVWYFRRSLSPLEVQQIYLATRWRYQ